MNLFRIRCFFFSIFGISTSSTLTANWGRKKTLLHLLQVQTIKWLDYWSSAVGRLFEYCGRKSLAQKTKMNWNAIGGFHDYVFLPQLPESSSYFVSFFKFCNTTEVSITISLICKRKQQTLGFLVVTVSDAMTPSWKWPIKPCRKEISNCTWSLRLFC